MSMMSRKIENATISGTTLGIESHGIMSLWVHLDGDSWGQGFGGYILDYSNSFTKQRDATGFGIILIRSILEAIDVENWEDLQGKNVRADKDHSKVHRLGHITKNRWVDIEAIAARYRTDDK